jgi:hypothetical protein
VVPRGAREWLWHLGALAAILLCIFTPGGLVMLVVAIGTSWLLNAEPGELLRTSGLYVITALLVGLVFGGEPTILRVVTSGLAWSRAPGIGTALNLVLGFCIEAAIGLGALGILMAFDRRVVSRATVDERVWQRQQARRRHLLRQWHRHVELPEVAP